jgi:ABC-type ATPase involved in cell division/GNAT superfamily N-acetyltransferase
LQSANGLKVKTRIVRTVDVVQTSRLKQMGGLFDVAPAKRSEQTWDVAFELPAEWNVGVIVGASGDGKTTVARELFGEQLVTGWDWPADKSILDGFPAGMSMKDITALLSSVGFSSPPFWMRPFRVLSNGQQFRVNLARTLAEQPELAVVDEFTSVVDRTVAQVGSAAVAKTVRRRQQKFIAVTCHYDVIDWLAPDWVYEPKANKLTINAGPDGSRGSLWQRPPLELEIVRVHTSAWEIFKPHHYLTAKLHPAAACFGAYYRGELVAFDAWLPFVGRTRDGTKARRGHRTVCLPDYQGVGIGAALFNHNASMWAGLGYRAFSCTAHPAEMRSRERSGLWRMTRKPSFTSPDRTRPGKSAALNVNREALAKTRSSERLTASFEYIGPAMDRQKATRCLGG